MGPISVSPDADEPSAGAARGVLGGPTALVGGETVNSCVEGSAELGVLGDAQSVLQMTDNGVGQLTRVSRSGREGAGVVTYGLTAMFVVGTVGTADASSY